MRLLRGSPARTRSFWRMRGASSILLAMKQILRVRSLIHDQFDDSTAGPSHFYRPAYADDYAAYYTSMFLIQDTGEAVMQHMAADFSKNPMQAYLEFWGVMQAIIIQQDAISELYRAVVGVAPRIAAGSAWMRLRDLRNVSAGHPARRGYGRSAPQRAFMGRSFGRYDKIQYELWDASTGKTRHPTFNLRKLISTYDREGCQVLRTVLASMKIKWP
jgi:hypothetical protein